MERESVALSIVGAISIFVGFACGGSTTSDGLLSGDPDGGAPSTGAVGSATTGAAGSNATGTSTTSNPTGTTTATTATGGAAGGAGGGGMGGATGAGGTFDPTGIGGIIGAIDAGGIDAGSIIPPPLPPEVVDGCNALCAEEATANCPNQGTLASCVVGCRLLLNNPKCAAATTSLFTCSKTSAVACGNDGKATLSSCPTEQLTSALCFLQSANDPTLSGPCTTYCNAVTAAMCPADDGSCASSCPVIGNFIPACNDLWKEYVTCANGAKVTCGNDGKAGAPACAVQFLRFAICLSRGTLNTGDAGP